MRGLSRARRGGGSGPFFWGGRGLRQRVRRRCEVQPGSASPPGAAAGRGAATGSGRKPRAPSWGSGTTSKRPRFAAKGACAGGRSSSLGFGGLGDGREQQEGQKHKEISSALGPCPVVPGAGVRGAALQLLRAPRQSPGSGGEAFLEEEEGGAGLRAACPLGAVGSGAGGRAAEQPVALPASSEEGAKGDVRAAADPGQKDRRQRRCPPPLVFTVRAQK